MSSGEIEFSAAFICFNEARHLTSSLVRLTFCKEIVVLDLGSTDGSPELAEDLGARVIDHPWVPYAPMARRALLENVSSEWVISLDPDMLFPEGAEKELSQMILSQPMLGMIGMAYQNYLRRQPLQGGRWGGVLPHFPAAINKSRVEVVEEEHRGHYRVIEPYQYEMISRATDHVIVHLWADTLEDVRAKLRRYAEGESQSRYSEGARASILTRFLRSLRVLIQSVVLRNALADGINGLRLALAATWYEWRVQSLLLKLHPSGDASKRAS